MNDILGELRELRQEVQDVRERIIKLEVGVGILRWLFAFLLALITFGATIASIVVGYIQGTS